MKILEIDYFEKLLDSLLEFKGSTTYFLESLRNEALMVEIKSQTTTSNVIKRETTLFFNSKDQPIIFSKSYLNIHHLLEKELELVKRCEIPLGKLFMQLNSLDGIKKENVTCSTVFDEEICTNLNISPSKLFIKRYDFNVSGRNVGEIIEIFNATTLTRIF
jgi:chorismate-pyruvate lyase